MKITPTYYVIHICVMLHNLHPNFLEPLLPTSNELIDQCESGAFFNMLYKY